MHRVQDWTGQQGKVREQTIEAIRRITRGLGLAAGLPEEKLPVVRVKDEFTPATYNDPELTKRLTQAFEAWLGRPAVLPGVLAIGGEDFSQYGRTEEKLPICLSWLGVASEAAFRTAGLSGEPLPSLHSPLFAPDPEPSIKTGVLAMTAAVMGLTESESE